MNTPNGVIRIISKSGRPFADRKEAGSLLAKELEGYSGPETVVLGIPRGGLVVAEAIACALNADLDIVISRKLRAPGDPEYAVGAVNENGGVFIEGAFSKAGGGLDDYIAKEKEYQLKEIKRRAELFRGIRPRAGLKNKNVIIVDDGLATGSTMHAAIRSARLEGPGKIIAAVPVSPEDTIAKISAIADETVCLRVPSDFYGVGQFYSDFTQVEDADVLEILRSARRWNGADKKHGNH